MGAGIGSWLGRTFGLARENMRRIAAVGAAAGIAAGFNTPITGVLFVIEEVIGAWNTALMGSTVLAAVSAVVVSRWFLGDEPLFRVPDFQLTHPSELLIYAVLGLVGGILAALFVRLITRIRTQFHRLHTSRLRYTNSFVAGFFVGALGLWLPQVLGAGYDTVDSALHDQFPWAFLLVLCIAKLIATAVCFGAGTPGGMFAPTLFIGAMMGGGIGGLARLYWPFPASPVDAYVLVGIGTFFAGVFRAPMTSVFMAFEISASYVIIVPVMIANTISYLVSRQLQPVPFFSVIAQMEGLDLPSTEQLREEQVLRVEDAMQPPAVPVFSQHTPVVLALAELTQKRIPYSFVQKDGGSWSLIGDSDLLAASEAGQDNAALGNALSLEPAPALHPDLPLDSALRAIGSHPILPVCSRVGRQELLGTLTLQDIHRAYGINHHPSMPTDLPH
jgi:CIC family chloride channel protein